jgi:hypothetical protein
MNNLDKIIFVMGITKEKEYIRSRLTRREILEQLAEEAAELSQAALKCIRAEGLSGNVTPMSAMEANENLVEEFNDVQMCATLLRLPLSGEIQRGKWQRWAKRLGAK